MCRCDTGMAARGASQVDSLDFWADGHVPRID